MKSIKLLLTAAGALLLILTGCKEKAQKDAAHVTFKLTDAPAAFDALYIDIKGVEIHTQASGWVMLNSSAGSINILQYVNGQTTVVAEGDIPQGQVDQIRLVLGSGNSIVVNGQSQAIDMSGSAASGLTVALNNHVEAGGSYSWTIDFDAAQSVVAMGTSSFQLQPTIRLIVDAASSGSASGIGNGSVNGGITVGGSGSGSGSVTVNGSLGGSVSGSVGSAGMAFVCVSGSNVGSVCSVTDLSGNFNIMAVAAGSYSVQVDPVLPLLNTKTISNVNVVAGQTTNLGLVVL
ncbi:MAG: DUF4382 domain-containing protein [Chitinophagales bacterium]